MQKIIATNHTLNINKLVHTQAHMYDISDYKSDEQKEILNRIINCVTMRSNFYSLPDLQTLICVSRDLNNNIKNHMDNKIKRSYFKINKIFISNTLVSKPS
ncbi:MAG: hypothetical protein GY730_03885, partial [bacterium]|nr:hypothetical protein [bacterium]